MDNDELLEYVLCKELYSQIFDPPNYIEYNFNHLTLSSVIKEKEVNGQLLRRLNIYNTVLKERCSAIGAFEKYLDNTITFSDIYDYIFDEVSLHLSRVFNIYTEKSIAAIKNSVKYNPCLFYMTTHYKNEADSFIPTRVFYEFARFFEIDVDLLFTSIRQYIKYKSATIIDYTPILLFLAYKNISIDSLGIDTHTKRITNHLKGDAINKEKIDYDILCKWAKYLIYSVDKLYIIGA